MSTLKERIAGGEFSNGLHHYDDPKHPKMLEHMAKIEEARKQLETLEKEKETLIVQLKKEYEAAKNKTETQFREELEKEFGVNKNHPWAKKMYDRAWKAGSEKGLAGVYSTYESLYQVLIKE